MNKYIEIDGKQYLIGGKRYNRLNKYSVQFHVEYYNTGELEWYFDRYYQMWLLTYKLVKKIYERCELYIRGKKVHGFTEVENS
jgi:hypothetical protein